MKEDKSLFALIFIFVLVVLISLFITQRRGIINFPFQKNYTLNNQGVPLLSINTKITKSKSGEPQVELILVPKDNIKLSAFSLRINLETENGLPLPTTVSEVNINPNLTASNWSFPINKLNKAANNYSLDLSGYHVGPQGYSFENPITLAIIPLNEELSVRVIIGDYDETLTKFYAEDAVKTIPYSVNK